MLPWSNAWRLWIHDSFLQGYFDVTSAASFIPQNPSERNMLYRATLLEKLLAEIAGELRHRPGWLKIPLCGLLEACAPE
jgi:maltose alpha-D-glucosyltransferase/alpha-amylase